MRKVLIVFLCLVIVASLLYAMWPIINGTVLSQRYRQAAEEFLSRTGEQDEQNEAEPEYDELFNAFQEFNEDIYENKQTELGDEKSYEAQLFDLADYGIEDGIVGVISIPKLDLEMPIYLSATSENMANGAAQLSYTSCPIGGENTNCVIAGHRGWGGASYFRYIDELEIGDEIIITNLWETLEYRVSEMKVIYPNDVSSILIQDGKDMVTLLTCHPYASGGRYRLLVYCERVEN